MLELLRKPSPLHRFTTSLRLALLLAVTVAGGGCMQRRMTIISNPPGATAYVDGVEIGKTPVSHDFLYYGTREIRLVRDGYETLTLMQPMSTPWYQIPPLDFFSDNLAFGEVRDERVYRYDLQPATVTPFDTVIARGEQLRRGSVAPASAAIANPPVITYPPQNQAGAGASQPLVIAPPIGNTPITYPDLNGNDGSTPPGFSPPPQVPGKPKRSWPTPN